MAKGMRARALGTLAATMVAGIAGPAWAQEPTLPATVESAKSYTPAEFARFAPTNALDMLRQVPGFTIQQADDRRGLGQASGNVLINGRRFSGKSNDVVTELGRIPVANVVRIDIVDGATLDVPGLAGQVANIITQSAGLSGNFIYRPQIRAKRTPPRLLNGEIAIAGQAGTLEYTLALKNDAFRNGNKGPEVVFTPDGTIIDVRDERLDIRGEQPRISGSLKHEGADGSIANLNAAFQIYHLDATEISLRSGPGQADRDRRFSEREREHNYEIGGDYELGLGAGRLKLIGLHRFEHSPYSQLLTVDFADGSPQIGERFLQTADEAEYILRGEYRWRAGGADWQLAAEGAYNLLDIDNRLFRLDAGGDFVPVPLPNSVAKVDEKRGEIALTYGRPLAPTLTFQASAGGEYSELSQTGANGLTRIFYRPKGFASLAWKASPRLDVSGRIERQVGQLNFFDFVASSNISAGTVNAGNVNLVPQQSWNAEVEASRNLGPWGTATAKLYARLITDIVDFVPIGATGQAPGNLDDPATVFGIQWTSTFNFDPVGWTGAKLNLDLQFQRTRLTDAVTGESRAINENMFRRIVANLRHDIPGTPYAYGVNFDQHKQSAGFRLDQRFRFNNKPGNLGVFVEHKDVLGLTVRASADNLLGTNESFVRTFYDGRRTGPILFTEDRDRFYGPIFTLSISGRI